MKACIAWLLTVCLLVCLCGCSGSEATESNATTAPDATTTSTLATEESSDTTTTTTTATKIATGKKTTTTTNSKVTTTTTTTGTRSTTSTTTHKTTTSTTVTTTTTEEPAQAKIFGDFKYAIKENCAVITAYTGTAEDVVIPDTIEKFPVKIIGLYAFMYTDIRSITIPDSVTEIWDGAFLRCSKLATVNFGNGITSIGYEAFRECFSLKKVQLPPQLKEIETSAFESCTSVTEVYIPKTLSKVGMQVFFKAESLTTVVLEEGIQKLGGYAMFWGCPSLKTLTIPASVKKLESAVFPPQLKTVTFLGDAPELDTNANPFGSSVTDHKAITIYYPQNAKGWEDTRLSKYTLKPMG